MEMNALTERLHDWSLDGGPDEEAGEAAYGSGWHGLSRFNADDLEALADLEICDSQERMPVGVILHEDDQGFVSHDLYYTEEELTAAWQEYVEEFEEQHVVGEVPAGDYNVEAVAYLVSNADRWEYMLCLYRGPEEVCFWDSNEETYNGVQSFDKAEAIAAAEKALAEIAAGSGGDYFDELKTP